MSTIYRTTQKPRRRYFRNFLIITGIVAVFGGGVYVVVRTKLFTIQSVEIAGNQYLASAEIFPYTPPFSYFKTISVTNIAVASSTIEKDFFEKSLAVSVHERERYGIWCAMELERQPCFWFDRTGFLFDTAVHSRGSLLKTVQDYSGEYLDTGMNVLEERLIPNLISIFDILDASDIPAIEAVLEDRQKQEITINTVEGVPLQFSLRIDPSFALEALRKLKAELADISYIDFRSEDRVFFKYRDEK